jgi:hypothetical protein
MLKMNCKNLMLALWLLVQTLAFLSPAPCAVADQGVALCTACEQHSDYDTGSPSFSAYDAAWSGAMTETSGGLVANARATPAYDPALVSSTRVVGDPRGPPQGIAGLLAAKNTRTVFRQGTFPDPATGWKGNYVKGQQWATDNPLTTPDYAQKYGLPSENTGKPDWVVGGQVEGPYTTRPAPASHNNPFNTGGATEVLPQNPNNVRLDWFHMPD